MLSIVEGEGESVHTMVFGWRTKDVIVPTGVKGQ